MSSFSARLIRWHKQHGRHDLPWQNTQDPYRVWLSEIMLQQTQVATVIPYYLRFLARFPQLADLAAAPVDEVMGLWSGLGYYARARNLHAAAQQVMTVHGGVFPPHPERLVELPGIGRSTANAIAVVCFGARVPILDGNVKRVICRAKGVEGYPGASAVEAQLWQLAEDLLPPAEVPRYIQAQMDLGAMVCTRGKPKCEICPLAEQCVALATQRTGELPQAKPRKVLPEREVTLMVLREANAVLLEMRPPHGIWGGLLSLPELTVSRTDTRNELTTLGVRIITVSPAPTLEHIHTFSHFRLHIKLQVCDVERLSRVAEPGQQWLRLNEQDAFEKAPLPAPIRKILRGLSAMRR